MYEVCNTKNMFENEFQKYYFYVVFYLIIKSYFGDPKTIFCIMQERSFDKIQKVLWKILFYFENLFLTVLYCSFEF
jgi:hypothetical protein